MTGAARTLVPVLGALLAAAALAGACFGVLEATLPQASAGQRIAIRALTKLDRWRSDGAVVRIGSRTATATCTKVRRNTTLLTFDDGARVLVRGRHVHALQPLPSASERLLADRKVVKPGDPELVAAEAVLGGSRSLYMAGLAVRLARGGEPLAGRERVDGIPAYVLRLGRGSPRVELLVAQDTLEPLAVRYSSARLRGTSRLQGTQVRRLASVGPTGC
jgi:hypothetical protein